MNCPSVNSPEDVVQPGAVCNDIQISDEQSPPMKKKQKLDKACADSTVSHPMLPPCRICGQKASGFHYGANTCEACKAFFRRSLRAGGQYACAASGNCEILPGKRISCAACRLMKCYSIGMSKSAIKTGRYTHAKKARDIMEVKGLQEQDLVAAMPTVPDLDVMVRDIIEVKEIKDQNTATARVTVPDLTVTHHSPLQRSSYPFPSETRPSSPVLSTDEMDDIIQRLTAVHSRLCMFTPEFLEVQRKNIKIYLEQKALHQEIFGPLQPLSVEEYMGIYQSTGIDVDGRRDFIQHELLHNMEEGIKRFVSFAKAIPAFNQLSINDQTALVKAARLDCWMILAQYAFDPDEKLYTNLRGRIISMEELSMLNDASSTNEQIFALQGKLRKLGLSDEERCILAAMCVVSSDKCVLENVDQVRRCHSVLRNCFLRLINKYRGDDPLFIAHVVAILVELRSISEAKKSDFEKFTLQWADKIDIPPLLIEMWSS